VSFTVHTDTVQYIRKDIILIVSFLKFCSFLALDIYEEIFHEEEKLCLQNSFAWPASYEYDR
jgi:hypothetical protein